MAGAEDTGTPRPTVAKVDVLIIGSGASGAAVAGPRRDAHEDLVS